LWIRDLMESAAYLPKWSKEEADGSTPTAGTPMLKVVADEAAREDLAASLDEIVRERTRQMLAAR
jgi:hypothetical protein